MQKTSQTLTLTKEQIILCNELYPYLRQFNLPIDKFIQSEIFSIDLFMTATGLELTKVQHESFVNLQKKITKEMVQHLKTLDLVHLIEICRDKGIWTPVHLQRHVLYGHMPLTVCEKMRVIRNYSLYLDKICYIFSIILLVTIMLYLYMTSNN